MSVFRDLYLRLVPSWLKDPEQGARVVYSVGLLADAMAERVRLSLRLRFPELAPADAMPYVARDRRLVRGLGETDAAFATRSLRWLDDHLTRGNAFALLAQLRAYLNTPTVLRAVDRRGNWYTLDEGAFAHDLDAGNWNWDGVAASPRWGRGWVIIYGGPWVAGPLIGASDLWGGAIGGEGFTIGSTATPRQVADVRRIVADWKAAGTVCEYAIVAFDPASFDPSAPEPDGTWALHHVVGSDPTVYGRLATARYWEI